MPSWTRAYALPERWQELVLFLLLLLLFVAPWTAPLDPTLLDYEAPLHPPSAEHWFGTDALGRDIFSRVLWGGRATLGVAGLGMSIALFAGTLLGLVAGYGGGWLDTLLMRVVDLWLALPSILLLLSVVALLGPGWHSTILGLGISSIPIYGRLVRASVLALKHEDYILAARAVGVPPHRILTHHILPGLVEVLTLYGVTGLGGFLLAGAGLGFLGLGAPPPAPEWGAMLYAGLPYWQQAWWVVTFPGGALFLLVFTINLLAEFRT